MFVFLSFICTIRCYCNDYAIVKFLSVRLSLFVCCGVEFGYWVCGESWLAIKDTLTHRPSSQGWAPSHVISCYFMCICVLCGCFGVCKCGGGFIYFSIYLSL